MGAHFYRILPLETIRQAAVPMEDGSPRILRTPCLPDVRVPIPPIRYGQVNPPERGYTEWPAGGWDTSFYNCQNADRYVIKDAIIHGEQGIITIDDSLVAESLYMAALQYTDFVKVDDHVVKIAELNLSVELLNASYMMCGFVSNRNYAHWWIDVLSTYQGSGFGTAYDNSVLVMPTLRGRWQRDALLLLPEVAQRAIFIGASTRISCKNLTYIPSLVHSDLTPHPCRAGLLQEVRSRAEVVSPPRRRIYVNRKDAPARRLINEDDVVSFLKPHGFESVTLSSLSVKQQVKLFGEATHVIGAHGAGLANLMFCQPGARLLELHMDSSLTWSIRRLSAMADMQYGCLLGDVVSNSDAVDLREWTTSLTALKEALSVFLS